MEYMSLISILMFPSSTKTKYTDKETGQKIFIQTKQATIGGENITWNGSLAQGQAMVKQRKKADVACLQW